jgi:transposase
MERRRRIVAAVRAGQSRRAAGRAFGVGLATVQLWLRRAGGERLDRVDWSDRPSTRQRLARIAPELEELILDLRRDLRETSVLGEYGAVAIQAALRERGDLPWSVPAVRTIGRVLERRGVLDAGRRVRRPAPPPGWYLPDVANRQRELDSFDVVEGLYLKGQPELGVLTAISLHGGLPGAWPNFGLRVGQIVPAMVDHWRAFGLPGYAQFDNDMRFVGSTAHPDSIGPVIRLCLALRVVPVFAPPRETGFQAAIEALNGRWQAKVWARFWDPTLAALQDRSARWTAAVRVRSAARIDAAPAREPFPSGPIEPWYAPGGRVVFLRRTSEAGAVSVLGHQFDVDRHWPHRLVRAEVDLGGGHIRFFALRRRDPADQPLLAQRHYSVPDRWSR